MISGWFLLFFPLLAVSEGYNVTNGSMFAGVDEIKDEFGRVIGQSATAISTAGNLQENVAIAVASKANSTTTILQKNISSSSKEIKNALSAFDSNLFVDFWKWENNANSLFESMQKEFQETKDHVLKRSRNVFHSASETLLSSASRFLVSPNKTEDMVQNILDKFEKEAGYLVFQSEKYMKSWDSTIDGYYNKLRGLSRAADTMLGKLASKIKHNRRSGVDIPKLQKVGKRLASLRDTLQTKATSDTQQMKTLLSKPKQVLFNHAVDASQLEKSLVNQPVQQAMQQVNSYFERISSDIKKQLGDLGLLTNFPFNGTSLFKAETG